MTPALDASLFLFFADASHAAHAGNSADVLSELARNLIVILAAGAIAGIVCRRLNISILIGYLAIGTVLGKGGLPVVNDDGHYVSHIAEAGVFLLLFTIGLELSLSELAQLSRWMLVGGTTQLLLVSVPVAILLSCLGVSTSGALLMAAAVAFSSTVLVFKALAETGDVTSPHGRRALAILLSQDVALVPLLLVIPLITQPKGAPSPGAVEYLTLAGSVVGFIVGIGVVRFIVGRYVVPFLAQLRSTEVVMLFTLAMLGGVTYLTALLGLPAPLGAFAAGLVLSDNRLTAQIDALVLPFREAFSAVFFVSLGLLLDPRLFITQAYLFLPMCIAAVALKTVAGAVAMRVTGLPWRASFGMALGLSQVGEFGFVLALQAMQANLINERGYTSFLLLAMVSMICTPMLLSIGLKFVKAQPVADEAEEEHAPHELEKTAIVIGMGPVGKQVACRLEMAGVEPFLIDLSHVNLYQFAQQGFRVLSGDASDPNLLRRALAPTAQLVAVCVPDDDAALRIVKSVREMNKTCRLVVRCRYVANLKPLKKAGADVVISEESEASTALLQSLDGLPTAGGSPSLALSPHH